MPEGNGKKSLCPNQISGLVEVQRQCGRRLLKKQKAVVIEVMKGGII
ncbi:MAG: hypothetical protein NWE92_06820 [Candidatus Bathyarchaeota archaeon]|nr:hypothetical protein [Candidatus Bathyarchaeota archaeon]